MALSISNGTLSTYMTQEGSSITAQLKTISAYMAFNLSNITTATIMTQEGASITERLTTISANMAFNITNTTISTDVSQDNARIIERLPGLISKEAQKQVEEIISCVLIPAVFSFGLVGNILSLIVLIYQGLKEPTTVLLVGLTVTDLTFIVLFFAFKVQCLFRHFDLVLAIKVKVLTHRYIFMLTFLMGRIAGLFVCLVALERFIAVYFPLKASRLITRKRVVLAMVASYLIGFSLGGCLLNLFEIKEKFDPKLNATILKISYTPFAMENIDFLLLYSDTFLSFVFVFFPVCFVQFCTWSIIRALRKSQRVRSEMTQGSGDVKRDVEQRKITKMLLSVCLLFITCTTPNLIVQVARLILKNEGFYDVGRYENISDVFYAVTFFLSFVNSSVNFVLYIATSKKFASTFRQLFCSCLQAPGNDDIASNKFNSTSTNVSICDRSSTND